MEGLTMLWSWWEMSAICWVTSEIVKNVRAASQRKVSALAWGTVTLEVRGLVSVIHSLAIGTPYYGPTSWHGEPIDPAWRHERRQKWNQTKCWGSLAREVCVV